MRIRAGRLKGRVLSYPRAGLRPTKDVTRLAVFNIIGTAIRGARVADLFAGGGALGLEALSRGAAEVVFVEQSVPIIKFLRENIKGLDGVKAVRAELPAGLKRLGTGRFDVVLADPPYRNGLVQATLARLVELDMVNPGGLYVAEHHEFERPDCPAGWEEVKRGRYGDSHVTVFRRNGE